MAFKGRDKCAVLDCASPWHVFSGSHRGTRTTELRSHFAQ